MAFFEEFVYECKHCGQVTRHVFGLMPWDDDVDTLDCTNCGYQVQVDKSLYYKRMEEAE